MQSTERMLGAHACTLAAVHLLSTGRARLSHELLTETFSVGVCVQKCPFDAIMIINLPKNLERETTHRYGPNSFKLHRCCTRPCTVQHLALCMQLQAMATGRKEV